MTTTTQSIPYTVPAAPEGTALIVRSRVVGERPDHAVELKKVESGATGYYSPHAPLQFFSAFDAAGTHLGTWSPGYPNLGWQVIAPEDRSRGTAYGAAAETLLTIRGQATAGYAGCEESIREWRQVVAGRTVTTWPRN